MPLNAKQNVTKHCGSSFIIIIIIIITKQKYKGSYCV